jgi:ribonucleoside-diphosphate reductase subunit M2
MENIHSEVYSLLIDSYISNKEEKEQLFNAVENFPCISKKADWAMKYMDEKTNNFSTRLVAFAVVEGIFFSSAFASIFWIKKKAILPGLCLSNEFISRDEALHCEFAILLYSKLERKLNRNQIYDIIKEAVEIEKEFIIEAIPCRLIGMNSTLMTQYIEFVADRLALQLGYDKIYNTKNPFAFMESISLDRKTNFFESRVSEYSLADKTINDSIFDLTAEF